MNPSYQDITPDQVDDLRADPELIILDTRDGASYARAHLEGAHPVSDSIMMQLMKSRQRDQPVLVYCYRGNSSRDVCRFVAGFGYQRVYNLAGGWQAWEAFLRTPMAAADAAPSLPPDLVRWLAAQGFADAQVNARLDNGMTPLMTAALQGDRARVEQLLDLGADPNHVNEDDHHALWFACVHGDPQLVARLIARGANVDNQNVNGATCAIYAASTGKLEVLKHLVEAGADLTRETTGGYNALESASTLPVLRYLRSQSGQRTATINARCAAGTSV